MKNLILATFTLVLMTNCSKDENRNTDINLTIFNADLTITENLDNGVAVLELIENLGVESLYGLEYGGGFVFHVDELSGEFMVARDFSSIGDVAWGMFLIYLQERLLEMGLKTPNLLLMEMQMTTAKKELSTAVTTMLLK